MPAVTATQLWDSRLLYIYALLGGFTQMSPDEVSASILKLVQRQSNAVYCLGVLAKLEATDFITASNITLEKNKLKEAGIRVPAGLYERSGRSTAEIQNQQVANNTVKISSLSHLQRIIENKSAAAANFELRVSDTEWLQATVREYLKIFANNKVLVPEGESIIYEQQKNELLSKMSRNKSPQKLFGVQQPTTPRFMDTILAMQEEEIIRIISLLPGSDSRPPGPTYLASIVYSAEAEVVSAPRSEPALVNIEVRLSAQDKHVYLDAGDFGKQIIHSFGSERGPMNLMRYLLSHQDESVMLEDMRSRIDGCEGYKKAHEGARRCGFNGTLKRHFFPVSSAEKIKFKAHKTASQDEATKMLAAAKESYERQLAQTSAKQ